ncbi:MAG: sulfatase-like hydrolase/transferase, partial [Tannerella sp.]|nr:sulfatase-like hydrolase/transferase [Tannerella sp.]
MEYTDRPNLQMLLAERKWAFILIFFIVLFNPLFYFLSEDVGWKNKCFAWLTCLAAGSTLSVIDLFFSRKTEKVYLSVLFGLSCAPNLIVWSYLYLFGIYFRGEMFWVIFDSNLAEGKEYLHQFIPWICFAVALLYMAVGVVCILKTRVVGALAFRQRKKLFAALLPALALIIGLQSLSQAVPVIEFYKSYLLFKAESKIFQLKKMHRGRTTMKVECSLPIETKHIFVVLIGESTSTCHMSLYGYSRTTTPFMDARSSELDVYTDVITPDTHTIGVLQKVLTFAGHEHPEYYHSKASVMEIFNVAGFKTYWISN